MLTLFMKKIFNNPSEFKNIVGKFLGNTKWKKITQKDIDNFASITEDFQWIHK